MRAFQVQMTGEQRSICSCAEPKIVVEASFTAPGVQAYRDAFRRLGLGSAVTKPLRIGTIEDFCASRLRRIEGVEVPRLTRPEQVRPFVLDAIPQAREWAEARYPGEFSIAGTGELAVEALLGEFTHIKGTATATEVGRRL